MKPTIMIICTKYMHTCIHTCISTCSGYNSSYHDRPNWYSIYLSVCLSIYLSVCLSLYLSIYLCTHTNIHTHYIKIPNLFASDNIILFVMSAIKYLKCLIIMWIRQYLWYHVRNLFDNLQDLLVLFYEHIIMMTKTTYGYVIYSNYSNF